MQVNKIQNNKQPNFQAGLTKKIANEIQSCDISKITQELQRYNIPADFGGNKMIAWCSVKCFEIIKYLNKAYGLNLNYPNGIFVEDFAKLKTKEDADGICLSTPGCIYKDDFILSSENTIFFNKNSLFERNGKNAYWDSIDKLSDYRFSTKHAPTDHFLYTFMHEFSHSIHNMNLINKLKPSDYIQLVYKWLSEYYQQSFQEDFGNILSKCCSYAKTNPFEAIACDLGEVLTKNLDSNTLLPNDNPLSGTPYLEQNFFSEKDKYHNLIKQLFNGDF